MNYSVNSSTLKSGSPPPVRNDSESNQSKSSRVEGVKNTYPRSNGSPLALNRFIGYNTPSLSLQSLLSAEMPDAGPTHWIRKLQF